MLTRTTDRAQARVDELEKRLADSREAERAALELVVSSAGGDGWRLVLSFAAGAAAVALAVLAIAPSTPGVVTVH